MVSSPIPRYRRTVPAGLQVAIDHAAAKYHISPAYLVHIWQQEDRWYPNPYLNSSGFGGLFGLSEVQARRNGFSLLDPTTTTQQANAAASDLSNLIRMYKGDVNKAMLKYSNGSYGWGGKSSTVQTTGVTTAQANTSPALAPTGNYTLNLPLPFGKSWNLDFTGVMQIVWVTIGIVLLLIGVYILTKDTAINKAVTSGVKEALV